ncbi:hypothetical protein EON67_04270 [archaeon]|nr:MAG: hypothetical protein EON67_04270 [archaeon]
MFDTSAKTRLGATVAVARPDVAVDFLAAFPDPCNTTRRAYQVRTLMVSNRKEYGVERAVWCVEGDDVERAVLCKNRQRLAAQQRPRSSSSSNTRTPTPAPAAVAIFSTSILKAMHEHERPQLLVLTHARAGLACVSICTNG